MNPVCALFVEFATVNPRTRGHGEAFGRNITMEKLKFVCGLTLLALAAFVVWQIVSCKLANAELQNDLHDLSAQVGTKIGLDAQKSDDELRSSVIRKASAVGIHLEPDQITVRRLVESEGTSGGPVVYLEANYAARVNLLVYSFPLHFNPTSTK